MVDVSLKPHKDVRAIGGCRLLHRLSAEGAGEVYLAEQIRLGNRRVAVTILTPEGNADERRFLYEAEMLGRFTHPHILPIHDSGYDRGRFYLVTHYSVAGSLADALCGSSSHNLHLPIATPTAADLVSQVAAALQYLHDHGVVHIDVQPANILIDIEPCGRWHMLLANFAHATGTNAQSAHTSVARASLDAYAAPEQLDGRSCPASDQYALAAIAFQLLSGHMPFEGRPDCANTKDSRHQPLSLRNLNPSVAEAVETVILRALAQVPAERYPSVAAFARALQRAVQPHDDATTAYPPLEERPSVEAEILFLHRALGPNHRSRTFAVPEPIMSDPAAWDTRPARYASQITLRRRSDPTTGLGQELRLLAVGIASVLLLLLITATSPGLWPLASSQGGELAKSLTGLTTQAGAPPVSQSRVLAPPPFKTTPGSRDRQQDTRGINGAAPLPEMLTLAVQPGQRIEARFSFANTGDTSWSHARGYALSCASMRHTNATCLGFMPISFGEYAVPPGGRFTFIVRLTAPARDGTFAIWLNVGHNGQLFGTQDMLLTVRT